MDIVINNAGVALISTVEDSDYEHLEWLMGINFWGVVYGTQAFLPLLRKAEQGHLVNLSSVFGLIGVPTQSAYNAAKFAVRGYTEALRQEMEGTNVHVCCVHPGGIKTNIARVARGGDPAMSADERGSEFEKLARTTPEVAAQKIIGAIEKAQEAPAHRPGRRDHFPDVPPVPGQLHPLPAGTGQTTGQTPQAMTACPRAQCPKSTQTPASACC